MDLLVTNNEINAYHENQKNKESEPWSLQEVFCYVLGSLLEQGVASVGAGTGTCAYRNPDGLKCAAGFLIRSKDYSHEIEGMGSLLPYEELKRFRDHVPSHAVLKTISNGKNIYELNGECNKTYSLVVALQRAHDLSPSRYSKKSFPEHILKEANLLCEKFGLKKSSGSEKIMRKNVYDRIIDGLYFVQTSIACPEQYEVFKDGNMVAYVRLRHSHLYVECPDIKGDRVFEYDFQGMHDFEDVDVGCFRDEEEADEFLKEIADKINEWIPKNMEKIQKLSEVRAEVRRRLEEEQKKLPS